ncbi:MAG: RDD family protein [Bryobacteraceae bacterium]|jgi:uncharacterized RDD family membrane protein YckC
MDATEQLQHKFCAECGRPTLPDELASFGGHMVCPECKNTYVQKLREGVAPGARAFRFGGFWIRFVASMLDGIILAVVAGIFSALLFPAFISRGFTRSPNPTPDEALAMILPMMGMMGAIFLLNMIVGCSYETFFIARLGATPGKMALGLKVVRPDGGPITVGRAAGRYFAKMISGMILMIGYIIAGFDSQKRALHDMICDTRVIRTQD